MHFRAHQHRELGNTIVAIRTMQIRSCLETSQLARGLGLDDIADKIKDSLSIGGLFAAFAAILATRAQALSIHVLTENVIDAVQLG